MTRRFVRDASGRFATKSMRKIQEKSGIVLYHLPDSAD